MAERCCFLQYFSSSWMPSISNGTQGCICSSIERQFEVRPFHSPSIAFDYIAMETRITPSILVRRAFYDPKQIFQLVWIGTRFPFNIPSRRNLCSSGRYRDGSCWMFFQRHWLLFFLTSLYQVLVAFCLPWVTH